MHKKAVLITGTSSGIGLETALYLAERGFYVFATMRDLGRRDELDREAARRKLSLSVLPLDITDQNSIHRALEYVLARSGAIFGLVSNAGTQLRGCFEDLSDREIRSLFETNVFGTMAVIRTALPMLRKASSGRVVIVSSVGGKIGSMALSAYCASKFALEGFGESLAQEVQFFGVQVILVEPAIINTPIWSSNRGIAEKALDPNSPYRKWFIKAERLADLMVASSRTTALDVAKVIHRTLTAQSPKLRYVVGRRAKVVILLRRHVPDRLFERFYFGGILRRVAGGVSNEDP